MGPLEPLMLQIAVRGWVSGLGGVDMSQSDLDLRMTLLARVLNSEEFLLALEFIIPSTTSPSCIFFNVVVPWILCGLAHCCGIHVVFWCFGPPSP